jgi:hypothetical protein
MIPILPCLQETRTHTSSHSILFMTNTSIVPEVLGTPAVSCQLHHRRTISRQDASGGSLSGGLSR